MSEDGVRRCDNKRRAESDSEDDEQAACKRERVSPPPEDVETTGATSSSRSNIEEAIKAIDLIQYELNMGNVLADSPDPSDHDTPPESEDESGGEEMLSQAHALGFEACIRETFRFLESCGVPKNDPIYKQLKSRFVETSN